MKAGELFVELGLTGADKTVGAISNVSSKMGALGSTSLEAKAAIAGAFYGLEQLFAASGRMGTELVNMESYIGVSGTALSKWQTQMRMAGGTAEEATTNFGNISKAMAKLALHGAPPAFMGLMGKMIGDKDLWSHRFDTEYMANAYVKGLKAAENDPRAKQIMNEVAASMGLTEHFVTGARRGMFDPSALKGATGYSEGQLHTLDKIRMLWTQIGINIEKAFANFSSKFGVTIAQDVDKLVKDLFRLATVLEKAAIAIGLFPAVAKEIEVLSDVIDAGVGTDKEKKAAKDRLAKGGAHLLNSLGWVVGDHLEDLSAEEIRNMNRSEAGRQHLAQLQAEAGLMPVEASRRSGRRSSAILNDILPRTPAAAQTGSVTHVTNNNTNTATIHTGADPNQVEHAVRKIWGGHVKQAHKNIPNGVVN